MAKKQTRNTEPMDEFYIVVARDCAKDVDNMKDSCVWYPDGDSALAEAAVGANDGEGEGFPQVVYRVQRYVEVK